MHDYSAEIVELTSKGRNVALEAFNLTEVPDSLVSNGEIKNEDGVKTFLHDFLASANPRPLSARNVALCLPASKVLTHIFELSASLSENDIRKSLPYEAENIIPFSFDDIYWDFTVLRKDTKDKKNGKQYVLFACTHREVSDRYAALLESAGLNPVVFGINAEIVKSAISRHLTKNKVYLALDIGILSVDSMILKDGVLLDYVSSNESGYKLVSELSGDLGQKSAWEIFNSKESESFHNAKSLERANNFLERCYNRGRQAILDFESRSPSMKVEGVVLTGHFLHLPGFYALAKKYFAGKDLIVGNPRTNIQVDDRKFKLWKETAAESVAKRPYAIFFTNAIGAALKGLSPEGINLIPSRLKEGIEKKKISTMMAAASVFMSLLSIAAAMGFVLKYNAMEHQKKELGIRKAAVQQMVLGTRYSEMSEHINDFNNEVNVLYDIDRTIYPLKTVTDELFAKVPEGISLSSWTYSDSKLEFDLSGIAADRDVLLKLRKSLEESKYISEVVAPISNYDSKTDISFRLTLKLDPVLLPYYAGDAKNT